MGHLLLDTERGSNGDTAWPLWGLAMRAIQAMGLHRDGENWKLPADAVEERRCVSWRDKAYKETGFLGVSQHRH